MDGQQDGSSLDAFHAVDFREGLLRILRPVILEILIGPSYPAFFVGFGILRFISERREAAGWKVKG